MSDASLVPEGLLRAIFEHSREAIRVSRAGVHVAVNPAYLRMFGYGSAEELLGVPVIDLIAPDGRPIILERIRLREARLPVPGEYVTRGVRRNGEEFDFVVRVAGAPDGFGSIYTIVMLTDVTEQLAAAKALAESQAFYRALFEVNTAVKLIIDPDDGRIVDANPAAVGFYGWPLEVLRSMRVADINTLPEDVVAHELLAAREEQRRYFHFRHRRASGDERDVEIYSGPFDVGGRRLLLSIIHDVTDRRVLEQRLHSSERMEALGRLAGGIAHDFNNLVAVVLANAEMLQATVPGDGSQQTQLRRIVAAAARAETLTRRLLALARRQVLHPDRVRLAEVALRIEDLARSALGDGIELQVDIDPASGFVWADASQLDQVVLNLITNARDAVHQGGHVTLAVRDVKVEAGEPLATAIGAGSWVCLDVADDGAGMDEATRARVFEPFFTTKPGVGTGLGLATVYGIVEQSKGRVLVESAPGAGSRFRVFLPRIVDRIVATRPGRVLLVEDNEDLRNSLAERLSAAGHQVFVASDGQSVFEEARRAGNVDLIVCDVNLPFRSGPEVVASLRERWPRVAVVLMSGATFTPVGLPTHLSVLPKPFTLEAFDLAVATSLDAGVE